jgi:hypothetical protein
LCFECSLHAPPEGWSQPERAATIAAFLAGEGRELRSGHADRNRSAHGIKRKGWRDHMPKPPESPYGRMVAG